MFLIRSSIVFVISIIALSIADRGSDNQSKKINRELRKYKLADISEEISSLRNEVRGLMEKVCLKPAEEIFIGNLIHSITSSWTTRCKFAVQAGKDVNADPTILPGYDFVVDDCYNTSGTSTLTSSIEDIDRFVAYYNKIKEQAIPFIIHGKSVVPDLRTFCAAKGCISVANWAASVETLEAPLSTDSLNDVLIIGRTIVKIVERYGWKYVGLFYPDREHQKGKFIEQLKTNLEANGVEVDAFETYGVADIDWAAIKQRDLRIFVADVSRSAQPKFLCELYKYNLTGEKYILMHKSNPTLNYFTEDQMANANCTREQIDEAREGALQLTLLPENYFEGGNVNLTEPKHYRSGKSYVDILSDIGEEVPPKKPFVFAGGAYDAVWAFALALKATFQEEGVVPGEANAFLRTMDGIEKLYANLMKVDFDGVTGPYTYNANGLRNYYVNVGTMRGDGVTIRGVGKYDAKTDVLSPFNESLIWQFKGGKPISDGRNYTSHETGDN
ncbi:unnamed protein product [Owenia fusiformis]|uniref:Receptor ligand binding region domain-containing protein n=1 Tax=Owenia fusiformis TaxID=6347 RepID=A0A8S4PQS3_OWEFU|nr:unnamed protein product [Owenia fusiformis]